MKNITNSLINILLCIFLLLFGSMSLSAQKIWSGTGFALNNGYLVTNWHVAKNAQAIHVYGIRGDFTKKYIAEVVAKDEDIDLAILKISGNGFPGFGTVPYKIKTNTAEVAEDVWVLGFPMTDIMGEEVKFSVGVINSLTGVEGDKSTYQISAQVSHGSSGGPVFDDYGNLIGIVSSGLDAKVQQNVYYAIKTSYLKNLVETMYVSNILPTNSLMGNYAKRQDKFKAVKNFVFYIECYDRKMPLDDVANRPSYINVSPTSLSFSEKQESKTLTISTNAPSWKVSSKPDWCTTPSKTTTSVTINATANPSYEKRSGTIVLETNDGKTVSFAVAQSGKQPPYLDICFSQYDSDEKAYNKKLYVSAEETQKNIRVLTNCNSWKVISTPAWCTITKMTYNSMTLNFAKNESYNGRSSVVVIKTNDGITKFISVIQSGKNRVCNGHEYVDLGLPSGTMWATCNVGANTPEESGDYFSWGEINPKSDYSKNNYKYNRSSSVLMPSTDAATANWGTNYRMPTKDEIYELNEFCDFSETIVNNTYGGLFIGPNGNSIFIPYTHYSSNTSGKTNYYGNYWSSSSYNNNAYSFRIDGWSINITDPYKGLSVRPVFASPFSQMSININDMEFSKNIYLTTDAHSMKVVSTPDWCNVVADSNMSITLHILQNESYDSRRCCVEFEAENGDEFLLPIFQLGKKGIQDGHEWVDLGLPSGTLWATTNLGAQKPEDYGVYYAWGEITTKKRYECSTYRYSRNDDLRSYTKYCQDSERGYNGFTDTLNVLQPSDDAATYSWGENWRMPTISELTELESFCKSIYTKQNGVLGIQLTGPNGNSIFLPAAGHYYSENLYDVGSDGGYWSSSLSDGNFNINGNLALDAGVLLFDALRSRLNVTHHDRCAFGRTIRPVCNSVNPQKVFVNYQETKKTLKVSHDCTSWELIKNPEWCTIEKNTTSLLLIIKRNESYHGRSDTIVYKTSNGDFIYISVLQSGKSRVYNGHEYVDLGLPSGTLWATCNVGASTPEGYGNRYAWGETRPRVERNDNYSYPEMNTLPPKDDAATVNWGIGWRMPTEYEVRELVNNCIYYTWTNFNGIKGQIFVGANSNFIFLPFDYGFLDGTYWSSSIDEESKHMAYTIWFHEGYSTVSIDNREKPYLIRPVYDKNIK